MSLGIKLIVSFLFLIDTILMPVLAASASQKVDQAVHLGKQFILQKFAENKIYLSCLAVGRINCPVSNSGTLLVNYFILNALKEELPFEIREKMVAEVVQERKMPAWLWGYNNVVIADADDTSFALQLLLDQKKRININDLKVFFSAKYKAYKTFITKIDTGPVLFPSIYNNHGIHLEVNANVFYLFSLLKLSDEINYNLIRNSQASDGSWEGYFYPGKYYATYISMRLLCLADKTQPAVKKGLNFILHSQQYDGSWGSPYDTSLALNTLYACSSINHMTIQKGVNYLMRTQQANGAWDNKKPIWKFVYTHLPLSIWYAYDNEQVLTTTLAVQALKQYVSHNEN